MKAIQCLSSAAAAPELRWEDAPDPVPGDHEVVLEIEATAVNRADLLQARGMYPPPPGDSPILGLEAAGRVAALGGKVRGWSLGDRVCALVPGGGYAERCAVHHALLMPLPQAWSFAQGAAVPEVWLTAFSNLFLEGGLAAGQTVLIHAGASGVGTAAIQLAAAAGARVAVTAGAEEKLARCRALGAQVAVNYRRDSFGARLQEIGGVDLVLDCVGGPYLADHLRLLKPGGRLVIIGLMGGRRAEIDLVPVLGKSLRVIGSRLRARSLEEKIAITRAFRERFWPDLVRGQLTPVIDRVFPIAAAAEAHAYVKANRNIGKVILAVGPAADAG